MMKRGGITLSVASGDSPTDSGNKLMISNIILSFISGITLYLTINLKTDVGAMKTDVNTNFNRVQNEIAAIKADTYTSNSKLSDLKYRFDAFGIGSAVSLGVFAGSGNIVKVLEYFDKKAENDKVK